MVSERARPWFGRLMVLGGMAAPLFLFLAGVAISLSAASQIRRGAAPSVAAHRVELRGWQLFRYAFLFRLQSFVLGGFKSPRSLLKVDILNVMGPAIALTARLWGVGPLALGPRGLAHLRDRGSGPRHAVDPHDAAAGSTARPARVVHPAAGRTRHVHALPLGRVRARGRRARSRDRRRRLVRLVAPGAASGRHPCDRPRARRRSACGRRSNLPSSLRRSGRRRPPTSCCAPDSCSFSSSWRGCGLSGRGLGPTRRVRSRRSAWGRFSSTGCTSSWSTASPPSRSAMP